MADALKNMSYSLNVSVQIISLISKKVGIAGNRKWLFD